MQMGDAPSNYMHMLHIIHIILYTCTLYATPGPYSKVMLELQAPTTKGMLEPQDPIIKRMLEPATMRNIVRPSTQRKLPTIKRQNVIPPALLHYYTPPPTWCTLSPRNLFPLFCGSRPVNFSACRTLAGSSTPSLATSVPGWRMAPGRLMWWTL